MCLVSYVFVSLFPYFVSVSFRPLWFDSFIVPYYLFMLFRCVPYFFLPLCMYVCMYVFSYFVSSFFL